MPPFLKFLKIFLAGIAVLLLLLAAILVWEARTSRVQAWLFTRWAQRLTYSLEDGLSSNVVFPFKGPEDLRRGYVQLPAFAATLREQGYYIESQTRFSPELMRWTSAGMPAPYPEKMQAGLRILDRGGKVLYSALYPQRIYPDFDSIPSEIANTLLFIENRDLLDSAHPYTNPAVEWIRFGKAISEQTKKKLGLPSGAAGGSTLATQIEKYRHSSEGRTSTRTDKIGQMLSASLRAYLGGENTLTARKRILLQYVNTVPLAAIPGYGEVNGLGDGLAAWYSTPVDTLNSALHGKDMARRGLEYRKALQLFIAHRRPSDYLLQRPEALYSIGDSYVRLLAEEGILSPGMRDAALAAKPKLMLRSDDDIPADFTGRKAINAVRNRLNHLLGVQRLYDLDRMDLTASTTLDGNVQAQVVKTLKRLSDTRFLDSAGLRGFRLLDKGDPNQVIYSFTLFETSAGRNLLRVQADNYEQPLDINEQVKLDLGSTAKLRTLVHYLEILTGLHHQWAGLSPAALRDTAAHAQDVLSRWVANDLATAKDTSLTALLEAGMERKYSANPRETFFTGGGEQTFANFHPEDNNRSFTVRDALRHSINLVFVRLMRDVVNFHIADAPISKAMVFDSGDTPERQHYLEKFADKEGKVFLAKFFRKYKGLSSDSALDVFFQGLSRRGLRRQAAAYRYLYPDYSAKSFASFIRDTLGDSLHPTGSLENIYSRNSNRDWSLADYGFVAGVHPLELWLASYLKSHNHASWKEVDAASQQPVRDTYSWLFKTHHHDRQDARIRAIQEMEAFEEIHRAWQRVGYPFNSLVPSLGTSIGASGDRPNSLAELVGILLNDGKHYPSGMVQRLHFAAGTPYETVFARGETPVDTLLPPELCRVTKEALLDVVENGTAARGRDAFKLPDGTILPLGGKTGTGDQRFETFGRGGELVESRVVNRTATFVFYLGDRFFGTLTAHVEGAKAANYGFTSALPVSILVTLKPYLMPLLTRGSGR